MIQAPYRIHNHEIDSKACAIVSLSFSKDWELRDLTGRDFGVDKIAEHFHNGFATSELLMLQIKGTDSIIDKETPKFSLETKTLIYADMFSVPFLLLYCSVNEPDKCYYVWLQEYIRVRLNYDNPTWRSQNTNTIYFPKENILGTEKSEEHLKYIAQFPKYQSSWVRYYLCLNDLCYYLPNVFDLDIMSKEEVVAIVEPMVHKLTVASNRFGQIPNRFIPDVFDQTICIGKEILNNNSLPINDKFMKFIVNCRTIQNSVEYIANRFDDSYLRLLYEIDGSADY